MALAYPHVGHVTVLLCEERAALLVEVATEEGGGHHRRDGHYFGGGQQTGLRLVFVADGLQELIAQIVDGGYGIVDGVLPIREGFRQPSTGRILTIMIGDNLG